MSETIHTKFRDFDILPLISVIDTEVESLRFLYGYKFEQPDGE